ncbi:MAG: UDP-N-acetylmuramoylalanine--D-glutamate ligase [Bacteroidota bacterium]|jgi:UDP-N-acetylmuramoylalanine--D-glutamate ligase
MSQSRYIVVLGAQESGVGAAILARQLGDRVFVSDKGAVPAHYEALMKHYAIEFESGRHSWERMKDAEVVVKSPGIPNDIPIIRQFESLGTPVVSEIEFAFKHTQAEIVAITGTNGKTTTAALTHKILEDHQLDVALGGNIGDSFARLVAEKDQALYVLEVSSFQLDHIKDFRPHIAVITNITPDHLDRYGNDFTNYVDAKFRICMNQTEKDYFIYDADCPVIQQRLQDAIHEIRATQLPFSVKKKLAQGAYLENNKMIMNVQSKTVEIETSYVPIEGLHNLKNAMAAGMIGMLKSIHKEAIKQSIEGFTGIAHRMQVIEEFSGVRFINDSKATNVNATYFALESVKRPVVWIAGGVDKGNDYSALMPLVREKVKAIICLGTDNSKLKDAFSRVVSDMVEVGTMSDAVAQAMRYTERGDTVLLSPACASFDLFKNYEHRGEEFIKTVKAID